MDMSGLVIEGDSSEPFWRGADEVPAAGPEPAPDGPEGWNNRGAARYARGDVAGALADLDRALDLRPEYPEALNNRGIVRHRLGDAAGALADFDRALGLRPRYAEALNNRAVTRMAIGDLAGALADFDRAIGVRPDYADAYHGRAAALHAWGDCDGALADYTRVLDRIPTEAAAPIHHLRAAVLVTQRRFADAVAECTRALALDPAFCLAYLSRGHARYHLRDLGGLDDYRAAFRIDPVAAAADVARMVARDLADVDEVLENCRKHIRISPDDVVAYARRGLTLLLLGREDEAARDFAEGLRRSPDWADHLALMVAAAREHAGWAVRPESF
jgi:tetratricopeptide (TPR) repeat protein